MATSHHGQDGETLKRFLAQVEGNAQRSYSEGRMAETDDGDLAFAVAADPDKGIVMLDFGKLVSWIGMGPEQAAQLGALLIHKARQISKCHSPSRCSALARVATTHHTRRSEMDGVLGSHHAGPRTGHQLTRSHDTYGSRD